MDARYLEKYLAIAAQLRAAGVNTEVYLEPAKLGNQLTYADRKGFRIAIIAGEKFAKDVVQLKNLSTKSAADVASSQIVSSANYVENLMPLDLEEQEQPKPGGASTAT